MIRSFELIHPDKMHLDWIAKTPALAKPQTFEFKPGLNILWGQNGSGKSTLIKALAQLFHCEQGYIPVITQTSVSSLCDRYRWGEIRSIKTEGDLNLKDFLSSFKVDHDGQGVRFYDPMRSVGLDRGAFDYDFMDAAMQNMSKSSSGETTMRRMGALLEDVIRGTPIEVKAKVSAGGVNDLWADRIKMVEKLLVGSGEKGPPTVLLDEPERSLDMPKQEAMWRFIRAYHTRVQFIVASHSYYALSLPEANYIELSPGYLAQSVKCLEGLKDWSGRTFHPMTEEQIKVQDAVIAKSQKAAKAKAKTEAKVKKAKAASV